MQLNTVPATPLFGVADGDVTIDGATAAAGMVTLLLYVA